MDCNHPLLSHQHEAVKALSEYFDQIIVLTGKVGETDLPQNVRVISTEWVQRKPLKNLYRFYSKSLPLIARSDFHSVFFHMTDLQCALIAPLLKLRNKKIFLWYAHTNKSLSLVFSSIFVHNIITSTRGSCPLKSSKVIPIGQAIDPIKFPQLEFKKSKLDKLVHLGRFDKSKNINILIDAAGSLRNIFTNLTLTIIGSPASKESTKWANDLKLYSREQVAIGSLRFLPAIKRSEFSNVLGDFGCFFHAYLGSLDKTLIESTISKLPVVTINPEYITIFGSWADSNEVSLEQEYIAMRSKPIAKLQKELERRRNIALTGHSLGNWSLNLSIILGSN